MQGPPDVEGSCAVATILPLGSPDAVDVSIVAMFDITVSKGRQGKATVPNGRESLKQFEQGLFTDALWFIVDARIDNNTYSCVQWTTVRKQKGAISCRCMELLNLSVIYILTRHLNLHMNDMNGTP